MLANVPLNLVAVGFVFIGCFVCWFGEMEDAAFVRGLGYAIIFFVGCMMLNPAWW